MLYKNQVFLPFEKRESHLQAFSGILFAIQGRPSWLDVYFPGLKSDVMRPTCVPSTLFAQLPGGVEISATELK